MGDPDPKDLYSQDTIISDWRHDIKMYITDGDVPEDQWAAWRLKIRSVHYILLSGELFRWSPLRMLLNCIHGEEVEKVMAETHEEARANHYGGRALEMKIKRQGFY